MQLSARGYLDISSESSFLRNLLAGVRSVPLTAALFLFPLFARAATGVFHEQVIPGLRGGATEVVRGPDGGFWFTEFDTNHIGTFSRNGQFREFLVPTPDSGPRGITGDSNAVWFTEF